MSFNIPKPLGSDTRASVPLLCVDIGSEAPPQMPSMLAPSLHPLPLKSKAKRKPPPIDFEKVQHTSDDAQEPVPKPHPYNMLYDHPPMPPAPHAETIQDVDAIELLTNLGPDQWQQLAESHHIKPIATLGEGAGGLVLKCRLGRHIFALKLINSDPNSDIEKQIVRELQYNRACLSPYIVQYYGTFMLPLLLQIGIAMEYMAGKLLDAVYKRVKEMDPTNRVNERVLGKIAVAVLKGLTYLHQQRIIHRDIKPLNILFDAEGNVKLCDFGVSGEVVNSLVTTFVGTQYYMAPERILGKPYLVTLDVWLLGLTLLEVALGRFPLHEQGSDLANMAPIALVNLILEYEPRLVDQPETGIYWSDSFKNFIAYCLRKNPEERPLPRQMLQHPWAQGQAKLAVPMDQFIRRLWG